jgi:hypothetical protein
LMSHCTLDEKTIMLYDLFDLADGFSDNIRPEYAYSMIEAVY